MRVMYKARSSMLNKFLIVMRVMQRIRLRLRRSIRAAGTPTVIVIRRGSLKQSSRLSRL